MTNGSTPQQLPPSEYLNLLLTLLSETGAAKRFRFGASRRLHLFSPRSSRIDFGPTRRPSPQSASSSLRLR